MASLLKDIYSPKFHDRFTQILEKVISSFNKKKFLELIFDSTWEKRELKDRMKHTAFILHEFFPKDFSKAIALIEKIIIELRKDKFTDSSLEFMFFPHYIEVYGIDYFDESVKSIEFITQFTSCEFAVRPFIIK